MSVAQVALALATALMTAPIVRAVTSELNGTIGRAWPFSLARCFSPATPGCSRPPVQSAASQPAAPHIWTGRL